MIPFTKPTPKRDLFLKVAAHSKVGHGASSMDVFFQEPSAKSNSLYF